MRSLCLAAIFACLAIAAPIHAQKNKREPLTDDQVEKIAEAGIDPNGRVALYMQFTTEHADAIKALISRGKSAARSSRLDGALQDLTALMDELGSNLDVFSDRKADIRKSLKPLAEATKHWLEILNALPSEPVFELSRKEALQSGHDLDDEVKQLITDQTAYFDAHKDEAGQDRHEPK